MSSEIFFYFEDYIDPPNQSFMAWWIGLLSIIRRLLIPVFSNDCDLAEVPS